MFEPVILPGLIDNCFLNLKRWVLIQVRTQQKLSTWRLGRFRKFVGKFELVGRIETKGASQLDFSRHSLLSENLGKRFCPAQLALRQLKIDGQSQPLLLLFLSDVDLLLQQLDSPFRITRAILGRDGADERVGDARDNVFTPEATRPGQIPSPSQLARFGRGRC